ncbi:gas vesicle protein GvpG [Salipiger marinus]|uniref:gas vesicle protein GvpG n=1 Tax=Salipiger marinus TaxID=555512 RepID=UPI000E9EC8DB|nr:gas vesicle protein [Citreicella sp.]
MGLLRKLITAPVTAPLAGAIWVTKQVAIAAEAEHYDPARLRRALDDLEQAVDQGLIDEAEYDAAEHVLLQRLAHAAELIK